VGSRGSTRQEGRRAGRRTLKEAESSREDETPSEDGVNGGRRETAWVRVKVRGRSGSGNPMTPQFVGIQHSGEHRTSREGAQGGVNPRCAAAGEAGTSEGEKRSDGFLGRWAH